MTPQVRTEFPSLEERIQQAGAERSVELGIMIGSALANFWRALEQLPFVALAPHR